MKKYLILFMFLTTLISGPSILNAQDVASMTGVVLDASGAVVPGVAVVLSNSSTGVQLKAVTDSNGSYRFNSVPAGPGYKAVFTHDGFASYTVDGLYLNVANSRTQNAKLLAGSNVAIDVDAGSQGVTLNTVDASIGNNIDVAKVNDLPVYDRTAGITTLFSLQPGVSPTGETTGARFDQNNVTLDGLDVTDQGFGDKYTIVANAPVDSVQEFRGTVAGFGAGSGQGGGGQYQLVSKSGTNHFHGNVNEYHRDTDLTANDWFNKFAGVGRSPLIRNQFGGNIGGPILHDKLFFFFNVNQSRIIQNTSQSRTVPLDAYRAGSVGYVNTNPGCDDTSRANTTPTCITYLTNAQITAIDPSHIGDNAAVAALLNSRYPRANDLTLGDGVNTGGFRFNAANDDFQTGYVSRVDYIINSKMSLYGRGTVTRENSVYALNQFPADPATDPNVDRSYAYVIGHTWQISPTKTNLFVYGETKQNFSRPDLYDPQGVYNPIFFSGTTTLLSGPYNAPSSNARIIPIPLISDTYNWQRGHHSIALGGTIKWIHSHTSTGADYNNVYVGLGGQTQGLNATLRPANLYNSATTYVNYDEGLTAQLGRIGQISGAFNFDANANVLPQGSGSRRQYRYYQSEFFASDSWKINSQLTFNYGLNYDLYSVPYEINGEESVPNTTFDKYMGARVAQSAAGISGNTSVPFISYELGGKANNGPSLYSPQHNNFAPRVGFSYNPSWSKKTVFNGSAGMVYDRTIVNALLNEQDQYSYLFQQPSSVPFGNGSNPNGSLTHCSSVPQCNALNALPATAGAGPRLGDTLQPFNPAPSTATTPFTPFVVNGVPGGLANGGEFNISVDPALKTPYSIMSTFGVQRELRGGFVARVSYVGRYGRRLLAQADANQLVDFTDAASQEHLGTAMGNITKALRAGANSANLPAEPFWENQLTPGGGVANGYPNNTSWLADNLNSLVVKGDFADTVQAAASSFGLGPNVGMGAQFSENTFFTNKGFSTYQGLLTTLTKNLSHGLQFDINYTYAHSIDNVSLIANSEAFTGYGFVCDVLRPRLCRGESDFDIKHTVTADFTYALPFGHGKQFAGNVPWYVDEAIGGWEVSGITSVHSGTAYSTVASAFVASYSNDAPAIFNGDKSAIRRNVHKTAAGQLNLFANPAAAVAAFQGPIGFQIGSRNSLRGPKYFDQDLGLGKTFALIPSKDINFKFRADAFNAFNHPSFNSPGTLTSYDDPTQAGNFGQLTSTASNSTGAGYRVLQVSGRIEF